MFEKYEKMAMDLGAVDVRSFDISDIVFDPRTILKCMYGCGDWGKCYNCPSDPKSLDIEQSIRIFKHYKGGVIIRGHDKKTTQRVSYEIEREAFLDGYHFALSLSDCALCSECMLKKGLPCPNELKARPAFHAVGIDVMTTVRALGMPIKPLRSKDEEQNWYSAVFIE